jgi:hypothetical protein
MDALRYFANGQRKMLQKLIVAYGTLIGNNAA